jgi:hypothetical protein
MKVVGVIVHHSVCPAINGKGYDFLIQKNGTIIPAAYPTDPSFIHICLEGDYSDPGELLLSESKEQLFLFLKLTLRLAQTLHFKPSDIFPHDNECPGKAFPWSQLVISGKDGYH